MQDRISLKTFWEAIEARLAGSSTDDLRAILRGLAKEIKPSERSDFLEKLNRETSPDLTFLQHISEAELVEDIDDLVREIQSEMSEVDEGEKYYRWDGYFDEENSLGPYEQFVEPVGILFDRAQAAFDNRDFSLARKAYRKLFKEVFFLEDDYGRGIQTGDLSLDIVEARGRYLRAVYETEPLEVRPEVVFDHLLETQSLTSHQAHPMLEDLIQITPHPLPDRELFFKAWILFLKELVGDPADAWLREAVRIFEGTPGLEKLARSRGAVSPRIYLDWFSALQEAARDRDVLAAAQEALEILPDRLPIRAAIADHLCAAASHIGERELLIAGRWQAFLAKPDLARFLDLWEATEPEDRLSVTGQAARFLQDYLESPPDRRSIPNDWESDGLEGPAWTDRSVLTHAFLLAHEFDRAHELAVGAEVLGWSNSGNVQSIVVPYFLALLSGKPPDELPPNLTSLWQTALSPGMGFFWNESDARKERLEEAYKASLRQASMPSIRQTEIHSWCLQVSMKRATAIVNNQFRKSYYKAAMVIVACAEVLRLRDKPADAEKIINEIRDQYPRHSAFQRELKKALQQH